MPSKQCGQRMVKVVSVGVGIGSPAHHEGLSHAEFHTPHIRNSWKTKESWALVPITGNRPTPTFRQVCRLSGRTASVQHHRRRRKIPPEKNWRIDFFARLVSR